MDINIIQESSVISVKAIMERANLSVPLGHASPVRQLISSKDKDY